MFERPPIDAMSIAVVAYEMEGERTGVGRYLEGLLTGIARCGDERRWRLYFKGDPFDHPLWTGESGGRFDPVFDCRPRARPILWEQLRLPSLLRRDRPELVFSPAYSLPPGDVAPGVVTVHDLSFELKPDDFPRKERWRRRLLARRAVAKARRVLTDTEQVARDLAQTYSVGAGKIGVVPLGIDEKFLDRAGDDDAGADDASLAAYGIRPPYLLHVGSILERRHVHLLIAAFAAVSRQHPELTLVLAGRNRLRRRGDLDRWIENSGISERIAVVGYVDEAHLVPLYRRATLSYYLSSYEGYGLPPLESLAVGTPAVVGRGLALDELWPGYPYRSATLDRAAVIEVTRAALGDEHGRRRLARDGRERMRRLDWRRAAQRFLQEIARA